MNVHHQQQTIVNNHAKTLMAVFNVHVFLAMSKQIQHIVPMIMNVFGIRAISMQHVTTQLAHMLVPVTMASQEMEHHAWTKMNVTLNLAKQTKYA